MYNNKINMELSDNLNTSLNLFKNSLDEQPNKDELFARMFYNNNENNFEPPNSIYTKIDNSETNELFNRMFNYNQDTKQTNLDQTDINKNTIEQENNIEKENIIDNNQNDELFNRMFSNSTNINNNTPPLDSLENEIFSRLFNKYNETNVNTYNNTQFAKINQVNSNVMQRMFNNDAHSETILFEIIKDIINIDTCLSEYSIKTRKLKKLKKDKEQLFLDNLAKYNKHGIKLNETNEIFCKIKDTKKKINNDPQKTLEITEFAQKHNITLSDEDWKIFSKLWKKNSHYKVEFTKIKKYKP